MSNPTIQAKAGSSFRKRIISRSGLQRPATAKPLKMDVPKINEAENEEEEKSPSKENPVEYDTTSMKSQTIDPEKIKLLMGKKILKI